MRIEGCIYFAVRELSMSGPSRKFLEQEEQVHYEGRPPEEHGVAFENVPGTEKEFLANPGHGSQGQGGGET